MLHLGAYLDIIFSTVAFIIPRHYCMVLYQQLIPRWKTSLTRRVHSRACWGSCGLDAFVFVWKWYVQHSHSQRMCMVQWHLFHGPRASTPKVLKVWKCCFHVSSEFNLSLWKGMELVAVAPCSCTHCMSSHTGGSIPCQGMAHTARTLEKRGPPAMNHKCNYIKWMVVALYSHGGWVYVFMQVLLTWRPRVSLKTRK